MTILCLSLFYSNTIYDAPSYILLNLYLESLQGGHLFGGWLLVRLAMCFVWVPDCLFFFCFFSHLGFWSGNLFLIVPFPDLCLLVPFHIHVIHINIFICGN